MISQWEENKHKLEEYFRTTTQDNYSEYKDIVKKIFELCLLNRIMIMGLTLNQ